MQKESHQSSERGTSVATIFGECAGASERVVCPLGASGVERLAGAAIVFSPGHHRAVGSLLHDSCVSRVLWTCHPFAPRVLEHGSAMVAFKEYQGVLRKAGVAVASS